MDFNKLTLRSQEAVAAAQELALRYGNPEIHPEHLLLALLDQELPQTLVADAAALRAQAALVRRLLPLTPARYRYFPAAIGADRRLRRLRRERGGAAVEVAG